MPSRPRRASEQRDARWRVPCRPRDATVPDPKATPHLLQRTAHAILARRQLRHARLRRGRDPWDARVVPAVFFGGLPNAGLFLVRDEPRRAGAPARGRERDQARLQEPAQPAVRHAARAQHRRRGRALRACHAPLWQAVLRSSDDRGQRPHGRDHRAGGAQPAVLQPAAFREGRRGRDRPAKAPHRRAALRPLCNAAARHGRGAADRQRRLHHRLAGRAPGSLERRHVRLRRLCRRRAGLP